MEEELLSNGISRYGLRELHVARMGAPVEVEHWMAFLPDYADAEMRRWTEEPLGIHHLSITWPCREVVHLAGEPSEWCGRDVLLWRLDKGESLRDGTIRAAVAYLEMMGRWPDRVATRKLPEGADEFAVYEGENERVIVKPVEASWAPAGYLVLYEEVAG